MDPARAKVDEYSNAANPIAQPVPAPYTGYSYPGTTAAPIQQQPYVVQSVPTSGYGTPAYTTNGNGGVTNPLFVTNGRSYPVGRWGDSICDWPSNIYPSCYCVCCFCCGMYLTAQIAQKVGYSSFRSVLLAFIGFCILGFILELIFGNVWIVWVPMIFAFCFSLGLRLFIVNKEQIHECGSSPCLGECCVGFWCWYCSVTQMARHVYGYSKVFDGDGDPYRPDQYQPVQNV